MVFVLDANKTPLAPCHPARARQLLKENKAAIYRKMPFTIILKKEVTAPQAQDFRLKIDYGSKHTGLAILRNENVVWLGQLDHRTNIKSNLDKRRGYRRRRRSKNLRYRQPRFLNRTRPKGWVPPSLQSRVDNILHWVSRLRRLAPIGFISYENVKFDTQLMQNTEIGGMEYQQGELAGYEVREYLLEKFSRKCVYCKAENVPLEVEHIVPKARGGSNRISNLAIACHECNQRKGAQTAKEFGYPDVEKQCKAPLRDAAIVTDTRWAVYNALVATGLPVECGSGGRTKYNRIRVGLPKDHCYDAACVGASTPETLRLKTHVIQYIKATGRGQHCRTNVDASGFPMGYLARQKQHFGFQTGDIVRAIVPKGKNAGTHVGRVLCRKTGSFDIKTRDGRRQGINQKYCTILQKQDGYQYEQAIAVSSPCLKAGASTANKMR